MLDSMRNRWLLAAGLAVVMALSVTALVSRAIRAPEKKAPDAVAIWKARTGVDLAALPRLHPAHPDSEDARALDVLLEPVGLQLSDRATERPPRGDNESDSETREELRESLRAAIRSGTTEPQAFPSAVVAYLERHAATLDAVADFVAKHPDIRWREDLGPRLESSVLPIVDHLTLHRLLIGRAFLALERGDSAIATRMLSTSRQLNRGVEERRELDAQFVAVGMERLQLALMRRAGSALGVDLAEPATGTRERYLSGMSAEAALILANTRQGAPARRDGDPPDRVIRMLTGPERRLAASEAVARAAVGVDEIRRSPDGCAELAKKRPAPDGFVAGNFHSFNATEAWRRFQVLELDRAITAAVLTGRTSSPCPSVTIAVRDDGTTRTVETKGLPAESPNVVALPPVVTGRLHP